MSAIEAPSPTQTFDLDQYLAERDQNPDFVMVEIGHGAVPVAYTQPTPFEGKRAYVGIEAWERNLRNNQRLEQEAQHAEKAGSQNIFYITHDTGGKVEREHVDGEGAESWYEGPFDAETVLPDGAASEVLLANVLSDPLHSYTKDHIHSLLTEAARLIEPGGHIVIRETTRPDRTNLQQDPQTFEDASLQIEAFYSQEDSEAWAQLEQRYSHKQGKEEDLFKPPKDSFYLILSKKPEA